MDFIEKLFGLSPDGGDGSTEAMWIGALALLLVIGIVAVRRHKQTRITVIGKARKR